MKSFENEIYAYALENALEFGKTKEGIVLPKLFQHGLKKEMIGEVLPKIKEIVALVNQASAGEKQTLFENYKKFLAEKMVQREGLPELPNVHGKPVLRMAPFPSGPIHIGNARTFLLNAIYGEQYNGKVLLVIDDTIGSEEKQPIKPGYELIPEALDWLNVKYKKPIIYKSDRLEIYYKYAKQLIRKDKAYVCGCSSENLRDNRLKMRACGCREFPVKTQLERWEKMFESKEGDYTLRIKTSMQHKNPAFRDRVIFRICERNHYRVKKKYKVWPLLDFSWAIDDHLLKITHIIRGKELRIEGEMQNYIWEIFKWKAPEMIYNGLMKLEGVEGKLSKSKSQKEVVSGKYIGWDDPRTWSIHSLKKRGITSEAIREFIEKIGLTEKEIVVPIDDLYAINRRIIDKIAKRFFYVENPVEIVLKNSPPKVKETCAKIHPEKDEMRILKLSKKLSVSLKDFNNFKGNEVRLMHLFNVKLDKEAEFIDEENKSEVRKIHWVGKGVKVKILMPTTTYSYGVAEENIKKLKKGEMVQFERFGFCKFQGVEKGEYVFWFTHN
ncbi:MAG: glutamate--tRNA ligase [Nanoarchaeota archaeon]|nr:glutamate--tRNA ligase [Nanoarchaeota archaeon]